MIYSNRVGESCCVIRSDKRIASLSGLTPLKLDARREDKKYDLIRSFWLLSVSPLFTSVLIKFWKIPVIAAKTRISVPICSFTIEKKTFTLSCYCIIFVATEDSHHLIRLQSSQRRLNPASYIKKKKNSRCRSTFVDSLFLSLSHFEKNPVKCLARAAEKKIMHYLSKRTVAARFWKSR